MTPLLNPISRDQHATMPSCEPVTLQYKSYFLQLTPNVIFAAASLNFYLICMMKYKITHKIEIWEKLSVTSHDLYSLPCYKLSHFLRPLPFRAWHILWTAPSNFKNNTYCWGACQDSFPVFFVIVACVLFGFRAFESVFVLNYRACFNSKLNFFIRQ